MSNVVCSVDTCPVILSAVCVVYQGENLIYTGITDGDNLQAALQKIDGAFADAGLGYAFQNGVIQTTPGVPVELGGSLLHDTTIGGNYKLTLAGRIEASALITTGGTSSQFVKGNGTLDSNAYQLAGNYITALTGDGTAVGPGSAALTLATVNANPGTYGSSTLIPRITVDAKGRVTAITTTAVPIPSSILVFEGDVTGSGTTGAPVTLTLATVNTNVYSAITFLKFKVNAKGLVTGASPVTNLDIEGALGYVPVPNSRTITINGVTQSLQANRTWTLPVGVSTVTATAPLASTGGATPNIAITKADATTDGYLDNVDWVTFNAKQAALNGTGFVKISGTTISYDNTTYTPTSRTLTINGTSFDLSADRSWTINSMVYPGAGIAVSTGTAWGTSLVDNSTDWNIAYSSRISSATVPLSIVSNTISISQASGSTDGYLSSTDWTTFNNKQPAGNYVTTSRTISTTSPLQGGGDLTADRTLSILQAGASQDGYLSSTDWSTFNSKEPAITAGTTAQYWRGDKSWQTLDTTVVPEGSNLYYTDGRVRLALSVSTPLTYNNTTGQFGIQVANTSQSGYLTSTDWNTFNNKQPAAHYITDLTGEATGTGPGIATVTLSTPAVTGKILTGVNITGGTVVATDTILQGFGKLQNQINALIGGSIYQGVWNAATNTPTLTSGVGTDGYYYITNVAGNTNLDGISDWHVGDWAIFHGGTWQQVDNTDAVVSVNGYTGAVSLVSSDIAEGLTNLYFTNTRARQALSLTTTGSSGAATYDDATGIFNIPNYNPNLSGYVPTSRTLTINGTAFDLTADRSWSVGTVTSVSALTIGTTGTDVTSSVATGTTTPVITLNIPTASATNRGALSSADWTTFNGKLSPATAAATYLPLAGGTLTGALGGTTASFSGAVSTNAPSGGATGEGLVVGQSFKIDGTGTSQRAVMYVVSNVLSDTYGSGLQAQFANLADDKGFGFNLNTTGGFELYVKNTSWNKALTIANTNAATFADTVTATSLIKTGGTSAQFLKADGSVDSTTYGTGTVTSVAALTIGTTGTDITSTVATGTTTPVITLNIPTASAANRGALSAADWTTFNSKQAALGGTGFVKSTAGTISYDTSTYLTTASAAATYLPLAGGTMTGGLQINTPSNTVGSGLKLYSTVSHQYLQIYSNGAIEAMVNYRNDSSQWYTGLRTTSQLVGTDGFHFYNTALAQTVGGYSASGSHFSVGNGYANGNRLVENTGTWAISISGNAATATSATSASTSTSTTFVSSPDGGRNPNTAPLPNTNPRSVSYNFAGIANITGATGNYAGVMTYSPWDGTSASTGDSSYQLAFCNFSGVNASGLPGLALRNGINSGWNATWYQMLHSGNYNSYSPTLTGGGASGTWAITATGNVYARAQSNWNDSTVISNVVGMLAWKNYGNNHVIFDASAGTSPSGGAVNATNSNSAWISSYPTLMGWNGASTYGVRVDSARVADSAGSATTAATATNSDQLNGITAVQLFNNMGNVHGTNQDFNSVGNFGTRYMQGSTNGPQSGQFYGFTLGLGSDYAYGTYGSQFYWLRNTTNPYIWIRYQEGGSWGGWTKTSAGYADTAGSATTATFATNSSKLYSTDAAYNYNSANPYYGFLTYDGTYWLFKVSPASPDRVRVYRSDTSGTADNTNSISSATGGAYSWTGTNYFVSNGNTPGNSFPLQAYSNNGSGAVMSFHRAGAYAVNFGLDSDNVMRIGGWSAGVNRWVLDMSGNMSTAGSYTSGGLIRVGASTNLYLDTNYGCSVVGLYASTRFQGVFAMGDAYKLAIDGTSPGNLYGISWSHPNAGGQATYLNDHGMMVMVNGVTYSALSSNIWARGRVTANEDVYSTSGWFYSNNNAGWYNNTYGQGIRPAKANLTYGTVVNIGENFNGYGGYGITNTYNTLYMQNSGGDHGFFRDGGGGGWSFFYHQNYNCAGIGTDATDPSYSLHIIKYGGSNTGWIIWSDRRIKENIKTIDNALDKVLSLRGVYYNKIDDPNKERCVGYIAQEVMEVVPELVVYSEELDMYNMNYGPMVGMLTEAVKEHHAKTVAQQAEIDTLKEQVQTLLNHINNGI